MLLVRDWQMHILRIDSLYFVDVNVHIRQYRFSTAAWLGVLQDSFFGFYLREAFQSQTNRKNIIQLESLGTDML